MFTIPLVLLAMMGCALAIVPIDDPIDIHPIDPIVPIHPFPPFHRTCAQMHCPPRQHCIMRKLWIFCFDPPCAPWSYPVCVPNLILPVPKVPIEIPHPDPISMHPG